MVSRYCTAAGLPCLDPWPLKEVCDLHGLDKPFEARANSIHCPVGMEPGSAFFLVHFGVSADGNALQDLTWTDGNTTTTFYNYVLLRAEFVGLNGDARGAYLLEFRDKRQVLKMATVDKEYNVRRTTRQSDSATTDLYYTDSRNGGSDWTWQTMFADLWGNLPSSIRGTAPTLATSGYVPVNEPENFRFHGSAWDAIGEVLAATHNVLCLNPITDTFTVQRLGSTQSGLSSALNDLYAAARLLTGTQPVQDLNLAVAPATIRFFFPKRLEIEASLGDFPAGGHLVDPYHTISKTTGFVGALAGTVMPYRTAYIAEVDEDGSTINNDSTLDTLAEELRDAIVDRINATTESGHNIYGGIVNTIAPGSEIHEMIWRDYGDDDGCVTELITDPEIGHSVQAEQFKLLPFTGEVLVANLTGSPIPAGSSGTVTILKGTAGSETATGQTISVRNRTSADWEDTAVGMAAVVNGQWYGCPTQIP